MKNKQMRVLLTITGGVILFLAGTVAALHAQEPPSFDGTWNTVTSKGKKIVVTLQAVRRTEISGSYMRNGLTASYDTPARPVDIFVKVSATAGEAAAFQSMSTIRGRVVDNVLRFRWQEDGGHGAGKFTLSADGQSFTGTLSMTDLPDDTSGGTWNGTRAPNFAGVWQTKAGEKIQFPQMLLQKSGNQITGHLFAGRPDMGVIKDGVVDGCTLRFTVWRPQSPVPIPGQQPDAYLGKGELTMNPDGKSFKGTLLGGATSGTIVAR